MILSLIVAMTEERVIGKDNKLPWHLPEDLKRFKKITMGHPIIMGRKTFESIGRPLPGRENIILSRDPAFRVEGVKTVTSFAQALEACKTEEAFVIGGSAVFAEALPMAERIYLTLIHRHFEGDCYFPPIDLVNEFEIRQREDHKGDAIPYSFLIAERVREKKAV